MRPRCSSPGRADSAAAIEIDDIVEWGPHVAGRFLSIFSFDEGRIVSIAQLGGVASSS